jgi:hypothetical protein
MTELEMERFLDDLEEATANNQPWSEGRGPAGCLGVMRDFGLARPSNPLTNFWQILVRLAANTPVNKPQRGSGTHSRRTRQSVPSA